MNHITIESVKNVAVVSLNRLNAMNALNNDLRDEIEQTFLKLKDDSSVRAVVLTTAGDHFSVGYDLEEVISSELQSFAHRVLEYHAAVYTIPKPLVCAIRGFALAGGIDLALSGDYIIASEKTIFGHPEIKFGAPPLVTSLARKIGPSRALELILKGEMIGAKKALEIGFINEVVPTEKLVPRAIAIAEKMGQWDAHAIQLCKEMANELFAGDLLANLKREFDQFASMNEVAPIILENVKKYHSSL